MVLSLLALKAPLTHTYQALFVYEYLITLFDEIRYVWKHKYSIATILFAINRYIVWIEITLQLYMNFGDLTNNDVSGLSNFATDGS